jgi:hypothetical protein
MKKTKKTQNVKMNLTLSREFYELLKENASNDFVRVATWTKQFLMRNLAAHKPELKCETKNEATMEV